MTALVSSKVLSVPFGLDGTRRRGRRRATMKRNVNGCCVFDRRGVDDGGRSAPSSYLRLVTTTSNKGRNYSSRRFPSHHHGAIADPSKIESEIEEEEMGAVTKPLKNNHDDSNNFDNTKNTATPKQHSSSSSSSSSSVSSLEKTPTPTMTTTLPRESVATVQMVQKMEGICRVTFTFPEDFDRESGQTFKVSGFKVILSEKYETVNDDGTTKCSGNVIVHDKSPAMEMFRLLEPSDELRISCYRRDQMSGPECNDIMYTDDNESDSFGMNLEDVAAAGASCPNLHRGVKSALLKQAPTSSPQPQSTIKHPNKVYAFAEKENNNNNDDDDDDEEEDKGYVNLESFFTGSKNNIPDSSPQCFVEHPQVISCSKRLVKENDDGSFELWIKTKAFQAVDSDPESISKCGLVAIGAKALEEEAKQFSDTCRNQAVDETRKEASELAREREEIHAGITNILQHGDIINCVSLAMLNSFGHPTYKLRLRCTETGREIDCMFKPKIAGDGDGWHQVLMELVAYKLNRVLGMDYVPPTAYRMNRKGPACSKKDTKMGDNPIRCAYKEFDEGAFIYWAQESQTLKEVEAANWNTSQMQLLSDTRVLDVLLGNSDRHHGHFLFAEHWVNAKPIPEVFKNEISDDHGNRNNHQHKYSNNNTSNNTSNHQRQQVGGSNHYPVLIDHAAAFRDSAWVDMTHENAFQTGPATCVSAKTYFRLRLLDARAIAKEFDGILTTSECRRLLSRRNDLLRYLDNLVAEKGYENVILYI